MEYWISIGKYEGFEIGDSVKKCDGGRNVEGELWDTEGVIIDIQHWHKDKTAIHFVIAENGDFERQTILRPKQVKKIDKEFILSDGEKMKLF